MKMGIRKPSVKRSISARTTGKLKREVKKAVNPMYGKKGMGYINNPQKAVYNKVYNKTSVGVKDIIASPKGSRTSNSGFAVDVETNYANNTLHYSAPSIDLSKYRHSAARYRGTGVFLIIVACILAFVGLFVLPIGLLFIGLGIFFWIVGKKYLKVSKVKKYNESNLPMLADPYIDATGDIWKVQYRYDAIGIKLVNCKFDSLKVNEIVDFVLNSQTPSIDNVSSISVLLKGVVIGNITTHGQSRMISDYLQKEGHMVQAQISFISKENVFLRIYYYASKKHTEKVEAEQKARYEAEKASYVRKPPTSFDTVLVYNGTDKLQYEIQQAHVGDKIEVEPDDDDRYLVSTKDSYDLGYLHKRIADKVVELVNAGYEIVDGEITEITENSGKFGVKVHLVLEDLAYL